MNNLQTFLRNETGAVTVDWVVITAGLVGLGLSVGATISPGVDAATQNIGCQLERTGQSGVDLALVELGCSGATTLTGGGAAEGDTLGTVQIGGDYAVSFDVENADPSTEGYYTLARVGDGTNGGFDLIMNQNGNVVVQELGGSGRLVFAGAHPTGDANITVAFSADGQATLLVDGQSYEAASFSTDFTASPSNQNADISYRNGGASGGVTLGDVVVASA